MRRTNPFEKIRHIFNFDKLTCLDIFAIKQKKRMNLYGDLAKYFCTAKQYFYYFFSLEYIFIKFSYCLCNKAALMNKGEHLTLV